MEDKQIINATLRYIEENLEEELSLEDIAKSVGYSKYHLVHLFAQKAEFTIHKYIQLRRLSEAARKLVETTDSIVDIAYEANYNSQQAFTLAFRQVYNCSPLIYRNQGIFKPLVEPSRHKTIVELNRSNHTINCKGVAA